MPECKQLPSSESCAANVALAGVHACTGLSIVAAAYDCLVPTSTTTASWPVALLNSCSPNAAALIFSAQHLILVILPLLFWCSSIIARWNQTQPDQPAASNGEAGGANGSTHEPEASQLAGLLDNDSFLDSPAHGTDIDACRWRAQRLAPAEADAVVNAGPEHAGARKGTSSNGLLASGAGVARREVPGPVQCCLHAWAARSGGAAWGCVVMDSLNVLPPIAFHLNVMRRFFASMGWPAVVFGPAFGWVLPLAGALLAFRLSGSAQIDPR